MLRRVVLLVAIALCGCGQPKSQSTVARSNADDLAPRLPFDNSTGFLDGIGVDVFRQGDITWSGMRVSDTVFTGYLGDLASQQGGHLFIEFEPGVAPARANWVRRQIIGSGLCTQHRCAEVAWHAERPVVN